jgi:hypothetical protein
MVKSITNFQSQTNYILKQTHTIEGAICFRLNFLFFLWYLDLSLHKQARKKK